PESLKAFCADSIMIGRSNVPAIGDQMPNIMQQCGDHQFVIGPTLAGELGALEGVFELSNWFTEIRALRPLKQAQNFIDHKIEYASYTFSNTSSQLCVSIR